MPAETWGRPSGGTGFPLARPGGRISVPSLKAPGGAEGRRGSAAAGIVADAGVSGASRSQARSNSDFGLWGRECLTRSAYDGGETPLLRPVETDRLPPAARRKTNPVAAGPVPAPRSRSGSRCCPASPQQAFLPVQVAGPQLPGEPFQGRQECPVAQKPIVHLRTVLNHLEANGLVLHGNFLSWQRERRLVAKAQRPARLGSPGKEICKRAASLPCANEE